MNELELNIEKMVDLGWTQQCNDCVSTLLANHCNIRPGADWKYDDDASIVMLQRNFLVGCMPFVQRNIPLELQHYWIGSVSSRDTKVLDSVSTDVDYVKAVMKALIKSMIPEYSNYIKQFAEKALCKHR